MTERAPRPPTLPVYTLRAAITREVSRSSLRRVAQDVGLSPNGLKNFLSGASPRLATRARLERWLAQRPRREAGPRLTSLVRLLGDVTADLPPAERTELGRQVATFLVHAYEDQRLPPPRWVKELASHYETSDPE